MPSFILLISSLLFVFFFYVANQTKDRPKLLGLPRPLMLNTLFIGILWLIILIFGLTINESSALVKDILASGLLLCNVFLLAVLLYIHTQNRQQYRDEHNRWWWLNHWSYTDVISAVVILSVFSIITYLINWWFYPLDLNAIFGFILSSVKSGLLLHAIPDNVLINILVVVSYTVVFFWMLRLGNRFIQQQFSNKAHLVDLISHILNVVKIYLIAHGAFTIFTITSQYVSFNISLPISLARLSDMAYSALFIYLLYRIYLYFEQKTIDHLSTKYESQDQRAMLFGLQRLGRLAGIALALIYFLSNNGIISGTGAIASSAVVTAAIGFASQKFVANLVGGLMLFITRPFTKGDWIKSPNKGFEGTVEDIGWYFIRIRTFERRPMFIPNSLMGDAIIENPGRMYNRRIKTNLSLRYDDLDKIGTITDEIRHYLHHHEWIDTQQTILVDFTEFASSSLDLNIYCFTKTTLWGDWRHYRQKIYLDIAAIIKKNGADFAYPTQTLKLIEEGKL